MEQVMERTDHQISVRVTPAFINRSALAAPLFFFFPSASQGGRAALRSPPSSPNEPSPGFFRRWRAWMMLSSSNLAAGKGARSSSPPLPGGTASPFSLFSASQGCEQHHACPRARHGQLRAGGARCGAPSPAPVSPQKQPRLTP